MTVRLGTRSSDVATRRAKHAAELIGAGDIEIVPLRVEGERSLGKPLDAVGVKGQLSRQLENALRRRKVDVAVIPLDELPTDVPEALLMAAVLPRQDARDAIVFHRVTGASALAELSGGSRVATASWRQRAQLLARRPDLEVIQLHGDLAERIRKLDAGRAHALVCSAAGLDALGLEERTVERLDAPQWLGAAGQGALALLVRRDDERWRETAARVHDARTARDAGAERALARSIMEGEQVPVAAQVVDEGYVPVLHGLIGDPDGATIVRAEHTLDPDDPVGTGERLASILMLRGGEKIVEELRQRDYVPKPQPE